MARKSFFDPTKKLKDQPSLMQLFAAIPCKLAPTTAAVRKAMEWGDRELLCSVSHNTGKKKKGRANQHFLHELLYVTDCWRKYLRNKTLKEGREGRDKKSPSTQTSALPPDDDGSDDEKGEEEEAVEDLEVDSDATLDLATGEPVKPKPTKLSTVSAKVQPADDEAGKAMSCKN